jgi:hypothetical protein
MNEATRNNPVFTRRGSARGKRPAVNVNIRYVEQRGADDVLPVPSRTYVISLPRRVDYGDIERLRTRLGVRWTYIFAQDSRHPLVARIVS